MTSLAVVAYGSKGLGKGGPEDPLGRKIVRRTIDYNSNVIKWLENCLDPSYPKHKYQCHYSYTKDLVPTFAAASRPYDAICCRFVHSSTNKNRSPVNCINWFPNGRRLITGTQTGEITVWSGFQFNYENILQAHNSAVRAMQWTPDESVLMSGDQLGVIKFWDQYFYNFQTLQAHKESIRDIAISSTGLKFCTCADDSHAKLWDYRSQKEERAFTGHGWDVKCCDWHPSKGLVATGSKDSQIKLWDPRVGEAITTIFCHKNTVTRVKWSPEGSWLASGSRDQLVMLMDVRTMSVRKVFKAHSKEITSLCWQPENDAVLASGGYENAIHFWDVYGSNKPIESLPNAHDGAVWALAWHPLGSMLVSGSHDYTTRFWSRARPGDSSFTELCPKRTMQHDPQANAPPVVPPVPKRAQESVLECGIFAPLPGPPPTPEELEEERKRKLAAYEQAKAAKQAKLDEEAKAKKAAAEKEAKERSLLDTSDFDAIEGSAFLSGEELDRLLGGGSKGGPKQELPPVAEKKQELPPPKQSGPSAIVKDDKKDDLPPPKESGASATVKKEEDARQGAKNEEDAKQGSADARKRPASEASEGGTPAKKIQMEAPKEEPNKRSADGSEPPEKKRKEEKDGSEPPEACKSEAPKETTKPEAPKETTKKEEKS